MVKDKDPSDIMNDVNGFDIITCKGLQEVQVVLVIPNIGYGFLSTMCARMTKEKGTSVSGPSMSYKITSGSSDTAPDTTIKAKGIGKELFVPSSGMDARMFTTRCNMNDICSTGSSFSNDIVLPIPLKISLESPNSFTLSLESKTYMSNAQEALFRSLLDICNSSNISGPFEDTIQASAAAQIVRAFSTTLENGIDNQWTGLVSKDTDRVEYLHLGGIESETDDPLESWDSKIQKTTAPPESTDIFIRPFAAVLAPSPDGKKRLYYSPDLTEKLFQIDVRGVSTPPKVICDSTLYLLNPEDNTVTSPTWGTVVGSDSIESSLGINYEDYWIISSELGRVGYIFSTDQIYNITSISTWNPATGSDESKTANLYTFRVPVFTSGGIIADTSDRNNIYRLLFSSSYYYPAATAEISDSVYTACTRCAGTGVVGSTTCLNCKGAGSVPCFNCAGKDLQYNEQTGTLTESTGYLTDPNTREQLYCKYCNPTSGETPEDANLYIEVPGRLKDTYCEGTGKWDQVTCPACNGTKISYQSKESTIGENDMVIVYDGSEILVQDTSLELYDSRDKIIGKTNPSTSHIELPIGVPKINGIPVDWIPESYTVEIVNSATEKTAVLSPTQESPVNPGTSLDIFTYKKNAQLQIRMPLSSIMGNTGPFSIKVYAVKESPTEFGYFWTTNKLEIPARTIGPNLIRNVEDIYKLMFKDPREIDDTPWVSGTIYEVGDITSYSKKLYKCITGHTASTFADDATNWSMIGYSPDPDEVPMREGFGHLACAIDYFIDIIETTSFVKHTSCYNKYDTKSINEDLEGLDICPGKISNDNPLKLYDGTFTDNISLFTSDRPSGNKDELFLTSKLPGSKVLRSDDHKKIWQNNIPTDMSSLEILSNTLEILGKIDPAIADLYEERIFPYGIRKTAKYIIGPKTPLSKVDVNRGKEIPLGSYGSSSENDMAPVDVPSNAQIASNGIVDIVSLLSSSSSMAGSLANGSLVKPLLESIPVIANMIITMAENILIEVDTASTEMIVSPDPLFSYDFVTSGEVPIDKMYVSVDSADDSRLIENIESVRDILSFGSGGSLLPIVSKQNAKFKQAMTRFDKALSNQTGGSGLAQASASSLCEVITYCYSIIDSIEARIIADVDYGAACTVFMAKNTNGTNTVLAVPREYASKGLWYYNLRKTYYILKSSINLCKAILEKAYTLLTAIRAGYSLVPYTQTGIVNEEYSNISYHNIDLSMFRGEDDNPIYPAIMGEDSWPEYTSSDDWEEEYGIIDLSSISSQVEINSIAQYFTPGSIGYALSIDLSGHGEIGPDNDPIFMMGMGTGSSINTLGTGEQIPYISRDNIHAIDSNETGWHTLTEFTTDDIYSKTLAVQKATGVRDHLKREGSGLVGYLTVNDTKGETRYTSLADMRSKIINGNLAEMVPFMGKPPVKGLIDMSRVFPYISNYSESFAYSEPLNIDFKRSEPKYIQDITGSLTNDIAYLQSPETMKTFFKCTSTQSSSSYLDTSSIFTVWDDEKAKLDEVTNTLVNRFNWNAWITGIIRDTTIPYQISFSGFTDPGLRNGLGLGTCLLGRYLTECGLASTSDTEAELVNLMASNTWNYQTEYSSFHTDYNYNLFLSKRRSFLAAKYIIGNLLLKSIPNATKGLREVITKDKNTYRVIIVEKDSIPESIGSPVSGLPISYNKYETGWSLAYKSRLFKSYGFGDLASNAMVEGELAMAPQRTVIVTAPHPGQYTQGTALSSGENMSCFLPLGNENSSSTSRPYVRISRSSIYYPTVDIKKGKESDSIDITWLTIPRYTKGIVTDSFQKSTNGYTRIGETKSVISDIYTELATYLGGGTASTAEINNFVAKVATDSSIKEKVARYIESLIAECFVKEKTGSIDTSYTDYGKAFHSHTTYLDNIWILVLKKD